MNLVIIGGKNVESIAQQLHKTYDDIEIFCYKDAVEFMDVIANRGLDVHRILLFQNAFDNISDDDIYRFVEILQTVFPAVKLITLSNNKQMWEYLATVFTMSTYVHLLPTKETISLTMSLVKDVVTLDIGKIAEKYRPIVYEREAESVEEIISEVDFGEGEEENNIPGYIAPVEPQKEKRGFFGKVLGVSPKKKKKRGNKGPNEAIGQVGTVDNFLPIKQFEGTMESFEDGIMDSTGEEYENNPYDGTDYEENNYDDTDYENNNYEDNNYDDTDYVNNNYEDDNYEDNNYEDTYYENNKEEFDASEFDKSDYDSTVGLKGGIDLGKKSEENSNVDLDKYGYDVEGLDDLDELNLIPDIDIETVEGRALTDNLDSMMDAYEESTKKVREVIIEKKVPIHIPVNVQSSNSKFMSVKGVKIMVVLSDRRAGATKFSLNLANAVGTKSRVLYIDLDLVRHGSLNYLGIDNVLSSSETVQYGLANIKTTTQIPYLVYTYGKGKFDSLISLFGVSISDEQVGVVEDIIRKQNVYDTIIIDCPIENVHKLNGLMRVSNFLICCEDNLSGITNTVTMLSIMTKDDDQLLSIYERSHFIVSGSMDISKFEDNLYEVVDLFDLETEGIDWTKTEILGNINDINMIAVEIVETK